MSTILAVDFVDGSRLPDFLLGLDINLLTILVLARLTYRRNRSRATYIFALVVVNLVVFFATYLMSVAAVSINVGFGLFALFGILRFRTGTLPVQEMTYLFAGIALGAFNALAMSSLTIVDAVIVDVVIVAVLELMGGRWLSGQAQPHSIIYERVELIHPGRRQELIADLETRTGLCVESVVVHSVNFLNDTAKITVRAAPTPHDLVLIHAAAENFDE
ncbi:MAG: DUF4956 domain-containing protein [Actinobacteria bacterium]|jgi:hypothetical protein|nr:DUF4956 domain-containing protein [Acidimicrobiaceae bacterium]MBT5579992.1 DUF4956 domain-containing protein [Acidimicrobiaceae bacterium]MBT5850516.1 DUF4956 domain-containing protein [Acidimicrobiaceae bacterium]NCG22544.1 DUF4956 domain-containing protein [Actinomycetota bacterium]